MAQMARAVESTSWWLFCRGSAAPLGFSRHRMNRGTKTPYSVNIDKTLPSGGIFAFELLRIQDIQAGRQPVKRNSDTL